MACFLALCLLAIMQSLANSPAESRSMHIYLAEYEERVYAAGLNVFL